MMKKLFLCALCFLGLLLCHSTRAQIFIGGIGVTNTTTNAPVQNAFITQTNVFSATLQPRTLLVTNIFTNENITLEYGWVLSGQGNSNFFVTSSNNYTFLNTAGWTNNSTWLTNIGAQGATLQAIPYGIMVVNSGSNVVTFQ